MLWKNRLTSFGNSIPSSIPTTHFQGVTLLFALYLLALGMYYTYIRATTPTDQNWFTAPPSELYIAKPVKTAVSEIAGFSNGLTNANGDSTRTGLFLFKAAGLPVRTEQELLDAVAQVPDEAPVEVEVLISGTKNKGILFIPKSELHSDNLYVMEGVAMVIEVMPNGASDRAGMLQGDLILQIDNTRFNSILDAEEILRSVEPGNTLAYDVMRGSEVLRLYVTLARYGLPVIMISLSFLGLLTWGAGLFVALKSSSNTAGRLIGWLFLSVAFIMVADNRILIMDAAIHKTILHTLFLTSGFTVSILLHLWFYFPKPRTDLTKYRTQFIAAVWIVPLAFHAIPLIEGNAAATFFGFRLGAFVIAAILPLFWFLISSTDLEYKKIARQVMSVLFLWMLVQIFTGPGVREFSMLLIPVTLLFVIGRYGLLELNIRIRRNIQFWLVTFSWYALLTFFFFIAFKALVLISIKLPDVALTTGVIEILSAGDQSSPTLERAMFMFSGMLLFFLYIRAGRIGQNWINRKYHRSNYDYRAANNRLHEIVSGNPSVDGLNRALTKLIAELMLVRKAGILVKQNEGEQFYIWFHQAVSNEEEEVPSSLLSALYHAMEETVVEMRLQNVQHPAAAALVQQGYSIILPLWSRTRMYGLLLLGEKLSEDTIDQDDIAFLNVMTHQLSVAYDNAFLYEQLATQERLKHEMKLARQIQLSSLPQHDPELSGLDVSGVSLPALEVGGDYYDYLIDQENRLTVIVGDVSGKGTSAALYLSKVQGIIRTLSVFNFSPRELFVRTNTFLYGEIERKSFVTAIGARFDRNSMVVQIARAGHIPLYHFEASSGIVHCITPRGMGMGMSSSDLFERQLVEPDVIFKTGDVFLFASDGVTELKNHRNEEFGEENLCSVIEQHASSNAEDIKKALLISLKDFNRNGIPNDDQTLVVVKIV